MFLRSRGTELTNVLEFSSAKKPLRILVVGKTPAIAELLHLEFADSVLKNYEFEVVHTDDENEASVLIGAGKFDVVISDTRIASRDHRFVGLDLLNLSKNLHPEVVFIVYSPVRSELRDPCTNRADYKVMMGPRLDEIVGVMGEVIGKLGFRIKRKAKQPLGGSRCHLTKDSNI